MPCYSTTEQLYDEHCHIYSHIYNNKIHDSDPYHNDGNFLYSDQSSGRNTYENNIMYGSGSMALRNNCGKENIGVNNIVHKTAGNPLEYMYGGCKKADDSSPWGLENFRNIYVFDIMDDFTFGRPWDRCHHFSFNLTFLPSFMN